jgi:hypothetical protein
VDPVTLIDAENVRRSEWPNIPQEGFVELVRAWVDAVGAHAIVVFDGPAPAEEDGARLKVVGTGAESADDWITRAAERLARASRPYRLVTSDRELRARAGAGADDVLGGGTFLRSLLATSGPSAPSTRAGRATPA